MKRQSSLPRTFCPALEGQTFPCSDASRTPVQPGCACGFLNLNAPTGAAVEN